MKRIVIFLTPTVALLVVVGLAVGQVGSGAWGLHEAMVRLKKDKKKEVPKDKTPPLQELKADSDALSVSFHSLATSADGKFLITATTTIDKAKDAKKYKDYSATIWDIKAGKAIATLKDHPSEVRVAFFLPDGTEVITTTGQWDKKKDKKDKKDEKFDGEIRIWNVKSGKMVRSFKGHSDFIRCGALSTDGKLLATGSGDTTVIIWDIKEGKAVQTLKGHKTPINSVAFNKDATKVVTGCAETPPKEPGKKPKPGEKAPEPEIMVKVWNVADGKETLSLKGPEQEVRSVAFSPDGSYIAAGSLDGKIYLWDNEGKLVRKLEAQEGVLSISFTHDSKLLAGCGYDDTTKVWDVASGKELFYRNGHKKSVLRVIFSPDDQRLVTIGMDQTLKIWEMPKDKK